MAHGLTQTIGLAKIEGLHVIDAQALELIGGGTDGNVGMLGVLREKSWSACLHIYTYVLLTTESQLLFYHYDESASFAHPQVRSLGKDP